MVDCCGSLFPLCPSRSIFVQTTRQGKELLLSQQTAELEQLAALILVQIEVDGPLSKDEISALHINTKSHYNQLSTTAMAILQLKQAGQLLKEEISIFSETFVLELRQCLQILSLWSQTFIELGQG